MSTIDYGGTRYECAPGETVLECLEREGVAPPSSCRSGVCQTCMMRSTSGEIPDTALQGLKQAQRDQGYFLSCVCVPEGDLELVEGDGAPAHDAAIELIDYLNGSIVRVRLIVDGTFEYRAGQFINLVSPSGEVRSYSIASVRGVDDFIELHIAIMPGGAVSGWISNDAKVGDRLTILGPQGLCYYVQENPEAPLLLAGTGTGLAPLYGILRDALHQGHSGPIHLFQGSVKTSGLYLVDKLTSLSEQHDNFSYYPCVLESDDDDANIPAAQIDAYIAETLPNLEGHTAYLCGHPDTVRNLQRKIFLAGAALKNINADAFLPAK